MSLKVYWVGHENLANKTPIHAIAKFLKRHEAEDLLKRRKDLAQKLLTGQDGHTFSAMGDKIESLPSHEYENSESLPPSNPPPESVSVLVSVSFPPLFPSAVATSLGVQSPETSRTISFIENPFQSCQEFISRHWRNMTHTWYQNHRHFCPWSRKPGNENKVSRGLGNGYSEPNGSRTTNPNPIARVNTYNTQQIVRNLELRTLLLAFYSK